MSVSADSPLGGYEQRDVCGNLDESKLGCSDVCARLFCLLRHDCGRGCRCTCRLAAGVGAGIAAGVSQTWMGMQRPVGEVELQMWVRRSECRWWLSIGGPVREDRRACACVLAQMLVQWCRYITKQACDMHGKYLTEQSDRRFSGI